jgi:hypothetical protein
MVTEYFIIQIINQLNPSGLLLMALEAAGEISKSVLRIDRNLAAEDLSPQSVSEIKR